MKKIVYIAVEVKQRELKAKIILATELANRGYVVYLGRSGEIRRMAADDEAGILIDKDFFAAREESWENVHKNGGLVYAWDEEGIVNLNQDVYLKMRVGDNIQQLDGIFLWGDIQKSDLLSKYPQLVERMYVVGNPRFDLLGMKAAKSFYGEKSKKIKKKYGKFILVNTSFGAVSDKAIKDYMSVVKEHSHSIDNDTEAVLIKRKKNKAEYFTAFLDGIKFLATQVDNNIIIRPHHGENFKIYEEFFSECKNVIVCSVDESNVWNVASTIMIHSGSTTAVEAYCNKRISIMFQPLQHMAEQDQFPNNMSIYVKTKEQLVDYVKEYLENPIKVEKVFFNDSKDAILQSKVFRSDLCSSKLIANVLDNNIYESDQVVKEYKLKFRERIRCMKEALYRMRNNANESKFSYTYLHEIKKICFYSMKVLDITRMNVSVKRICKDVFEIKNRS